MIKTLALDDDKLDKIEQQELVPTEQELAALRERWNRVVPAKLRGLLDARQDV